MLDISKQVQGFLKDLQQANQYRQIASKLFALIKDSKPPDSKHIAGHPGYFRVDSGEYRIIYESHGEIIRVALIGKRNDNEICRQMQRVVG